MASALLIKSEQHSCRNKFSDFTMGLISELQQCFETEKIGKDEREVIWGTFHKVRCSESFRKLWITFVNEILDKNPLPIFYQDISHNIFTEMVKKKFSVLEQIDGDSGSPLNIIEENTLRYVTGYVCKQVIKKLRQSTHTSKEAMIFCVYELCGDEEDERGTETWLNELDRGGLWHTNDMAYALFYAMEVEVRSHLTPSKAGRMTDGTTELLTTAVLESDDVLFHWSMFGTDMDTGVGMELLKIIVQLYITIRGFSFANSYVELFKQRTKKNLQKGKGLRNELFTSSTR